MEQWRSEVIRVEKPRRHYGPGSRLATFAKDIAIVTPVAVVLTGALAAGLVYGYTPGNALSEPTDVIEGQVVQDAASTDVRGAAAYLNPLLEAAGLDAIESLPPYIDSYQVFVLQEGGAIVPVEFLSWSAGNPSSLEEIAAQVEPGMLVRIPVIDGLTRHYGHSLDVLGEGELPEILDGIELSLEPTAVAEGYHLGWLGAYDETAPYRLNDSYLTWSHSDDPLLSDPEALADALFERLSRADMSNCEGTAAEDVYRVGHADLVRLSLLMDHLDSIYNRRELALMMSEDMLDHSAEHGGMIRLSDDGIDFHEIPSNLPFPDDHRYDFNASTYFSSPLSVAMFHFHAQAAHIENACPSGMEWGEGGDIDIVRELRIPGVMLSSLSESRFNAMFTTKSA